MTQKDSLSDALHERLDKLGEQLEQAWDEAEQAYLELAEQQQARREEFRAMALEYQRAGKNSARRRSVLLNALDAVDPPRRNRKSHREPKLLVTSTTASSSSAGNIEDIVRLIPAHDRAAFGEMLQHELRGRELPVDETRRIAEQVWKRFLKEGWP